MLQDTMMLIEQPAINPSSSIPFHSQIPEFFNIYKYMLVLNFTYLYLWLY
uniref:Uncharacterized protein n=1 Tax=Anguilla anguilla TaxID=7936 RepID=A0A0E9U5N9_ANGAN